MPKSSATTVAEYLAELPADRRDELAAVRDVIVRNLPEGYTESIGWGMITYTIPLARYPNTYNRQPLGYVALAAQKNYCSLHLMCVYGNAAKEQWLREAFRKAGKKLDMGKGCVRFRKANDLPLDAIGELIAGTPPDAFIASYERALATRKAERAATDRRPKR